MLAVLTLFSMLASIDKNFLTLLVGSIKRDIGISDVEMGLIIGVAFALSNMLASIPAGWMADRYDRRKLVGGAVSLWSVMAMMCGAANSYTTLFLARVGVGFGEGISPPSAYSLIRDGVPTERHGRAYGIFSIGASVGAGLSFVVGGALLGLVIHLDISSLPIVGEAKPWQISLMIIGLAGLPLSLLAFAFPDPGRPAAAGKATIGFGGTIRLMAEHRNIMLPLIFYSVSLAMLANAWAAWAPAIIERTYGLTPQQVGPRLGLLLMIGAPIGLISAGLLMDRLGKKGASVVGAVTALVMMIAAALVTQMPSIGWFWIPMVLIVLSSTTFIPVTSTVVARTMPAATIGKTMAIFVLVQGALGSGFGPVAAALIAERVFLDAPFALNNALTALAIVLGGIAVISGVLLRLRSGDPAFSQ